MSTTSLTLKTVSVGFVVLAALAVTAFGFVTFPRQQSSSQLVPTAVSCPTLSIEERTARADLIVTGSVFAVLPLEGSLTRVLVEADRVYKGAVPEKGIEVVAIGIKPEERISVPGGDLHFTSNDPPYLLFLRQREDGRYLTSRCDGSRVLGSGFNTEEGALLRQGAVR